MEEQATAVVEASNHYVGRWNRLVSTTNWEKGRIISEWRVAMQEAGVPAGASTDEAWSQQIGGVTPQHVGRLRRVFERFDDVHEQYPGLYWSHFQTALDWPDAEMYLEGALQNGWSVAQMRDLRWEAVGGAPESKPTEGDVAPFDFDEDAGAADGDSLPATISESIGEVRSADDPADREYDASSAEALDDESPMRESKSTATDSAAAPRLRPFESLPPLPADLKEAFELMKLAILAHKVCGWAEIAQDDVLSMLESLKQLALAPAE